MVYSVGKDWSDLGCWCGREAWTCHISCSSCHALWCWGVKVSTGICIKVKQVCPLPSSSVNGLCSTTPSLFCKRTVKWRKES